LLLQNYDDDNSVGYRDDVDDNDYGYFAADTDDGNEDEDDTLTILIPQYIPGMPFLLGSLILITSFLYSIWFVGS
jgi:hypothetical protein